MRHWDPVGRPGCLSPISQAACHGVLLGGGEWTEGDIPAHHSRHNCTPCSRHARMLCTSIQAAGPPVLVASCRNSQICRALCRGFRIDAATLQLTHVSRGPVVSSYMDEGDPHHFLIVGSYHFDVAPSGGRHSLLLFFGRRNTQSCYDWVGVALSTASEKPAARTSAIASAGIFISVCYTWTQVHLSLIKCPSNLKQVDIESTAWYRVPPGQAIDVKDLSSHNYEL